jgi:endonuclease YncB( thermonuclease family)
MAARALVEGQPLNCSFRQAAGAPKAICWVGDNDVTESLLSQGWAELAEGVTEESYVEAEAWARRIKVGIWGDGPP